jgi:mannose-1-phosphate guanylyltransferase
MSRVINVILSGGSGTRLWPLSRESKPKQFLQVFQNKSLYQETLKRNLPFVDGFSIVTNENQIDIAKSQCFDLDIELDEQIIESVGRNTAPAIAFACMSADVDDVLFVTPSDQMIGDLNIYSSKLNRAIELAKEGNLVTFGLKPTSYHTGFGYIENDNESVKGFREKPNFSMAKEFVDSGNFLWNSGMFCFKAGVFLEELKKFRVDIFRTCKKAYAHNINGLIPMDYMRDIPSESVDYAVFENSSKVKVVPSDFFWTDLGSFDAMMDYASNNKIDKLAKIKGVSVLNSSALSPKKVVGIDVEDLLIVETEDTILVMKKGSSDKVKTLYNNIKISNPNLLK